MGLLSWLRDSPADPQPSGIRRPEVETDAETPESARRFRDPETTWVAVRPQIMRVRLLAKRSDTTCASCLALDGREFTKYAAPKLPHTAEDGCTCPGRCGCYYTTAS